MLWKEIYLEGEYPVPVFEAIMLALSLNSRYPQDPSLQLTHYDCSIYPPPANVKTDALPLPLISFSIHERIVIPLLLIDVFWNEIDLLG